MTYLTSVQIINGFWIKQVGQIWRQRETGTPHPSAYKNIMQYIVRLDSGDMTDWISELDLKAVK